MTDCGVGLKLEYDVQGVNDTLLTVSVHFLWCDSGAGELRTYRNVTQDGQQDVDEEIRIATTLEEDT